MLGSSFHVFVVFLAWTGFSFLCHWSTKLFLSSLQLTDSLSPAAVGVIGALVITGCQVLACVGNLRTEFRRKTGDDAGSSDRSVVMWALLSHLLASFATNYSLAMMKASHTLMIKLLEPIMSAFILWWVLRKPVTPTILLSLILVIIGAMGFIDNWNIDDVSMGAGTALALISNAMYGVRNTLVKHVMGGTSISLHEPADYVLPYVVAFAAYVQCAHVPGDFSPEGVGYVLLFAVSSAVCHVAYSYISTCVMLEYLSVVAHAVANIGKRVLVVLLLMIIGDKMFSPTALMWLGVATLGLVLFTREKLKSAGNQKPHEKNVIDAEASTAHVDRMSDKDKTPLMKLKALILILFALLLVVCTLNTGAMMINASGPRLMAAGFTASGKVLRSVDTVFPQPIFDLVTPARRKQRAVLRDLFHEKTDVLLVNFLSETGDQVFTFTGLKRLLRNDLKVPNIEPFELGWEHVLKKRIASRKNDTGLNRLLILQSMQVPDREADIESTLKLVESNGTAVTLVVFDPWRELPKAIYAQLKEKKITVLTYIWPDRPRDRNVRVIPHLGLSIGRQERIMSPLYDVVHLTSIPFEDTKSAQFESSCDRLGSDVTCDSKNWDSADDWRLPRPTTREEVYHVGTYSRFLCPARGKLVITEHVAGHVAAALYGIPHVIAATSDWTRNYFQMWESETKGVHVADNRREGEERARVMLEDLSEFLPPLDYARQALVKPAKQLPVVSVKIQ